MFVCFYLFTKALPLELLLKLGLTMFYIVSAIQCGRKTTGNFSKIYVRDFCPLCLPSSCSSVEFWNCHILQLVYISVKRQLRSAEIQEKTHLGVILLFWLFKQTFPVHLLCNQTTECKQSWKLNHNLFIFFLFPGMTYTNIWAYSTKSLEAH